MQYNVNLSDILYTNRIIKNISKNKLAELVGISRNEITRIESGERKNPNLKTLIKICEVLDIDFINLLVSINYLDKKYLIKNQFEKLNNYHVSVRKIYKKDFLIKAKTKEDAEKSAINLMNENDIIDDDFIEKFDIVVLESDGNDDKKEEENIPEYSSKDDDFFSEGCPKFGCEHCEYYCPICNECTYDE